MKNIKRLLSVLMLLTMLLSTVSCRASLEDQLVERYGEDYIGMETGAELEGGDVLWKINDQTLTVFGEGSALSMAMNFFPWKREEIRQLVTELIVEDHVTALGAYGFSDMSVLETVTFEKGAVSKMGMGCFMNDAALKTIDLGDSLYEIPMEAFSGCSSLQTIRIPKTVEVIGLGAFASCDSLKTVYFGGTEEEWNQIDIDLENETLSQAEILFENN